MPTNMVKHPHIKFQDIQHKNCTVKTLIALQSTVGAKWSFGSQKFKFLVNISFWSHNHHLINSWSWFHKTWLKKSKDAKVSIFGQLKSLLQMDQGITSSWFIRKIPSKANFEGDEIYYNSFSHSKSKKCSHKKLSISTL